MAAIENELKKMHKYKNDNDGAYLRRHQESDILRGLIPSPPRVASSESACSNIDGSHDKEIAADKDHQTGDGVENEPYVVPQKKRKGGRGRAKVIDIGDGNIYSIRLAGGRKKRLRQQQQSTIGSDDEAGITPGMLMR